MRPKTYGSCGSGSATLLFSQTKENPSKHVKVKSGSDISFRIWIQLHYSAGVFGIVLTKVANICPPDHILHGPVAPVSDHLTLDEAALGLPRLLQVEIHLVVLLANLIEISQVLFAQVAPVTLEEEGRLVCQQILQQR